MKKNIYPVLALAAYVSFICTPLYAEVSTTSENPAQNYEKIPTYNEYQEPSELQRQQAEHKKANSQAPTAIEEPLEPSEMQHQQIENNKSTGN